MRIAIMQPYLFPNIPYFQLIDAVDLFVIQDEVQWIKGGWINRNYFQYIDGRKIMLTLPVERFRSTDKINEVHYVSTIGRNKYINHFKSNYSKSPVLKKIFDDIEKCIMQSGSRVSEVNMKALRLICDILEINTPFVKASDLNKSEPACAQSRIHELCKVTGATEYFNLSGGQKFYDRNWFENRGLLIKFYDTSHKDTRNALQTKTACEYSTLHCILRDGVDYVRQILPSYNFR